MNRNRIARSVLGMAILAGGALATLHSPAAHAAGGAGYAGPIVVPAPGVRRLPLVGSTLTIIADHAQITANGAHFFTGGRSVFLYAYGTDAGSKTLLGWASTIPAATTTALCLGACTVGSFSRGLSQPNDPCTGQGYSQIDVDAWTTRADGTWYEAASATAAVTCSVQVPPR